MNSEPQIQLHKYTPITGTVASTLLITVKPQ